MFFLCYSFLYFNIPASELPDQALKHCLEIFGKFIHTLGDETKFHMVSKKIS